MATYSILEIYAAARAAGFSEHEAATWTAIALAESGGRTTALNDRGEHSMGLWQINVAPDVRSNHWGDLNDPMVNARAAYEVSRNGRDMRPWTTTHAANKGTAHDYRTYLAEVEAQVGVQGDWRGVSGYGASMPTPLPDDGLQHGTVTVVNAATGVDAALPVIPVTGSQQDSDHDGLTDAFELQAGSSPQSADADKDGLSDGFEIGQSHSDPRSADADKDSLSDATEVALGTNTASMDTDHDGLTDLAEARFGTRPLVADAGDGLPTGSELPQGPPGGPASASGSTYVSPTPPNSSASAPPAPQGALGAPAPSTAPAAGEPGSFESTTDRFVQAAVSQRGDRYIYGAEANLSHANPKAFDCSELIQWAAHQAGVTIPDGAEWQYLDLKDKASLISVDQALKTKGALLFSFSFEPTSSGPRPPQAHVAISLGDGHTIEARGRAYGVDEFSARNRFNYAGVIPGISATEIAPAPRHAPDALAAQATYDQIDRGLPLDRSADADHDGLTDAFERLAGAHPGKADTDRDGLTDAYEALKSHTDPLSTDTDRDGLSDSVEIARGTDPGRIAGVAGVSGTGKYAQNIRTAVLDTDHDGLSDHFEKVAHLNPRLEDSDDDRLSDPLEVSLGTDPTKVDTDGDGLTDRLEIQLARDPLRLDGHAGGPDLGSGLAADGASGGPDSLAPAPAEPHPPPLGEDL